VKQIRQVVHRRFGQPSLVAEIDTVTLPELGPTDVLVDLAYAPIHPAELLMFTGRYGHGPTRPVLPRRAGIEGVGLVSGGATELLPLGTPVALVGIDGVWSDQFVLPAAQAIALPDSVPLKQLSMALANPQSVLLILEDFVELKPGDWVIQNAANSGFGRILRAVCAQRQIAVVNVVRSAAAAEQLLRAGVGDVLIDGPDLASEVAALTGGNPPVFAVDAVGGAATNRLAGCLASGGVVANYGLLSGKPCELDSELCVFNDVRLAGFWTPRSLLRRTPQARAEVTRRAVNLLNDGAFEVPVEQTYGLADIAAALDHSDRPGRSGKILLTR
jgi:NADPH:quinone reductase-like Zn-dependent oxidoreductase